MIYCKLDDILIIYSKLDDILLIYCIIIKEMDFKKIDKEYEKYKKETLSKVQNITTQQYINSLTDTYTGWSVPHQLTKQSSKTTK